MWKYCDNISQLGFFIHYIISSFWAFISSIRFFFCSFFFSTHVVLISIPFFYFLFILHSRTFQHLFSSAHSLWFFSSALSLLSFFYLILERGICVKVLWEYFSLQPFPPDLRGWKLWAWERKLSPGFPSPHFPSFVK